MAYSSGTATSSQDQMSQINTALTNFGYTFVETTTNGAVTADVFLNPSSLNSFATDFYISVVRSADGTGGYLNFRLHEGYDSVNHKMQSFAPGSGQTSLTPAASTYKVNAQTDLTPATVTQPQILVGGGGSSAYVLSITADRIVFGSRNSGTNYGVYAGLYTPFYASDPFPLCTVALHTGNSTPGSVYGATTREPFTSGVNTYNFFVQTRQDSSDFWGAYSPTTLDVYSGYYLPGIPILRSSRDTTNTIRGWLKDLLFYSQGTTGVIGTDTVTVDGVTYSKCGYYAIVSQAV